MSTGKLSIIIPLAPADTSWQVLLEDFAALAAQAVLTDTEILFLAAAASDLTAINQQLSAYSPALQQQVRTVQAGHSRATAMNAGASVAQGEYLWFVHADSRLQAQHVASLLKSMQRFPHALHYFNLRFYGHPLMGLNAIGVWIRSHWLRNPFGDQALCLRQQDFIRIGAYPEDVRMGEDHVLVWHALQQGMQLKCTGTALLTSARKYAQHGWLKTTALHVSLWAKQAWPEFKILLTQRRRT
ncbi:glycosyltransferase [Thiothrix winogradskyi]|uniref:Glycosyltransferase n=1 Tax=Thiothrix winogradskyi TaxID=96472 RepID=A0ABY3T620_9GAMM|nr:glycosyltransferase [Thiothrix winogradskyi]UJS26070.1 glycosyltransferase [Thiothrix winogradskyi]